MKKTLCALAVGATLFTPALAMAADVKVYGRAHVSLDYLDDGADYNEVGLSSNSSRLGFKAEQKLENGMTVFGQIEQEINFASGSANDDLEFATRDTFVGLKGDFGQARVGRFDSPFKVARGPVNFFGDQLGDIRNVTRAGNLRFDERNANTIEYKSPKFGGGFNVLAALSLHEGNSAGYPSTIVETVEDANGVEHDVIIAQKGDTKKDKAYDLALTYKEGPVDFAAAYEHYEEDAGRGERDGFRVAAAYKITPELNFGGLYQYLTHDNDVANPDAQVFGVAADYKFAPKTYLRGQVFHRDVDADDANATLLAVGLEHRLDKAVRVYGNLATVLNDENSNLTPWSQGRSNSVGGTRGEDAFGLSLGFRYDF
ncbi:porin [Acinetobacter indicus]|uniref:porin n=1 Tax=Acinetobacter indicus TaxID=756892 RepID=UPI0014445978|nr:porin [Acinetobacter indicus]MDM1270544.1 porin [Acinetobacter indicus]